MAVLGAGHSALSLCVTAEAGIHAHVQGKEKNTFIGYAASVPS